MSDPKAFAHHDRDDELFGATPKRPSEAERKATKKPRKGWCPVDKVCSLDCQNGCEKFDQKAFNERWRWG